MKKAVDINTVEDAETLTLEEADKQKRFGRILFRYGSIKEEPIVQLGGLMRYFFPVDIKMMGDDGYCMIGFSPLFRPLAKKVMKLKLEDVPFYNMEQEEGTGRIIAREQEIKKVNPLGLVDPTGKKIKV